MLYSRVPTVWYSIVSIVCVQSATETEAGTLKFIAAKSGKQMKCPPTGEWINKLYPHTMEGDSASEEGNSDMWYSADGHKGIMLSEKGQLKPNRCCMILLIQSI